MTDTLLIVDDEKSNLEALNRLLRKDFTVTTTASALEALKLIQTQTFAIVLSDQRMPDMTGVDLLEKTKNVSPNTTRILLTGYTDIDAVIEAVNRGNIYQYVSKPWDPEGLKLTLKRGAEAFRFRQELEEKNRQLLQALENLKGLDKAKARFLSLVSHELKTPLTVLTSFLNLLVDQKNDLSKDLQKAVASLEKASNRFSEIIEDVITFVRFQLREPNEGKNIDLHKVLGFLQKEFSKKPPLNRVHFHLTNKAKTEVRGDSDQLTVAFKKLLEDVVERANHSSNIELSSKSEKGRVCIGLEFSGEPFSETAFQPLDFQKDILKHQRGLGLGLAIFKWVVDSYHGELKLLKNSKSKIQIEVSFPAA